MVVDDLECELIRAGYIDLPTQSVTPENDSNDDREDNWQLLFPEVVHQDHNRTNSSVRNSLDGLEISHDQQEYNSSNSKEYLNLSDDSSSEDLILIDHNRISGKEPIVADDASTSNNVFVGAEDDSFLRMLSKNDSSSSDESSIGHTSPRKSVSLLSQGLSTELSSPMRKPPLQVMHKGVGGEERYDPRRIPSCVFERCDSLIPAEWSVTSTESLFSLHVGNASIGREQALLSSGELPKHKVYMPKSQEFAIADLDEMSKLAGLPKPIISHDDDDYDDELAISSPSPSIRHDGVSDGESDHEGKTMSNMDVVPVFEKGDEVMKKISAIKYGEENQHKPKTTHSSSISLHSNASEDSNYSFAFPVFVEAEKNALAKGSSYQQPILQKQKQQQQQQQQQQQDIISPSVAFEQPMAPPPRRKKGFLSCCLKIFCCTSCCHCPSCTSCCPACASCGSHCISSLACIMHLISCSPCKTCWRNGICH